MRVHATYLAALLTCTTASAIAADQVQSFSIEEMKMNGERYELLLNLPLSTSELTAVELNVDVKGQGKLSSVNTMACSYMKDQQCHGNLREIKQSEFIYEVALGLMCINGDGEESILNENHNYSEFTNETIQLNDTSISFKESFIMTNFNRCDQLQLSIQGLSAEAIVAINGDITFNHSSSQPSFDSKGL